MENVLDLYERPYDPERPVVCFDESSKQLLEEKRLPWPLQPGQPERYPAALYETFEPAEANRILRRLGNEQC